MDKLYVADTETILDHIESLQDYKVVLLSHTLREMEAHKSSNKEDLKYKARNASRYIKENKDKFHFDTKDYDGSQLGRDYDNRYQDNNILFACVSNGYGLLTNDVLLGYKGEGFGLEVISLKSVQSEDGDYTGIKEVHMLDEEIANFYENLDVNKFNLLTNQYVIMYSDITGKHVDTLKWNGSTHVKLKLPVKKDSLAPQNEKQACAIDMLNDKNVPIRIIAGTYGSGKTYVTTKMALYHVKEKGNHSKIMVIRNPIGSGEEIGFLKGTKEDKTQDFFKPFVQHLEGGEQEATYLEQRGELIKEIPYYIKGLSIDDTFVIVDEAEDLNLKMLKLIGTRLGKNSVITFSGDYNQAENKFINDNGLKKAIDKLKGNPLVGIVILDEDIRSEASKVFAELN